MKRVYFLLTLTLTLLACENIETRGLLIDKVHTLPYTSADIEPVYEYDFISGQYDLHLKTVTNHHPETWELVINHRVNDKIYQDKWSVTERIYNLCSVGDSLKRGGPKMEHGNDIEIII